MSVEPRSEQTAIRTDLGAIFISMELSRSVWLLTSLSPENSGGFLSDAFQVKQPLWRHGAGHLFGTGLRSRLMRRRSSCSGVGAQTMAHTRGSPRL